MLDRLMALFGGGARRGGEATPAGADEAQIAAAALLVTAACIDGHFDDAERNKITKLLADRFNLEAEISHELLEAGRDAAAASTQFYEFTRLVNERFSPAERIGLIEMLWAVIYADEVVDDYEANLVRRVAGLIYVSDRDAGEARKRVIAARGDASAQP
jgi:uncharacterized tellurite resistance protein B-like protein